MSAFSDKFKKNAKAFKQAREAKPSEFSLPDIEDGSYVGRVSAEAGVYKNGAPHVTFKVVVSKGDYEGTQLRKSNYLDGESLLKNLEYVVKDLKTLLPDKEEDIASADAEDLDTFVDDVAKRNPLVRFTVKNGTSATSGKPWQSVYFNEVIDDDATTSTKKVTPADSDDEDEDEGDDEEATVEVGTTVLYTPKGGKEAEFTVVTVNEDTDTVTLKGAKGKTYQKVPTDKLSVLVVEED